MDNRYMKLSYPNRCHDSRAPPCSSTKRMVSTWKEIRSRAGEGKSGHCTTLPSARHPASAAGPPLPRLARSGAARTGSCYLVAYALAILIRHFLQLA